MSFFFYLYERAREVEIYVVLKHVKNKLHEDVQTGVFSQIANTDCLINHHPFRDQVSSQHLYIGSGKIPQQTNFHRGCAVTRILSRINVAVNPYHCLIYDDFLNLDGVIIEEEFAML